MAGLCVAAIACVGVIAFTHGDAVKSLWNAWRARDAGPVARVDAMPMPGVVLWAWERPDDLSAVQPGEAGVAYFAGTIFLGEGGAANGFEFRPRMQPLKIGAGVARMPVVRIETSHGPLTEADPESRSSVGANSGTWPLTDEQRERVVETLARIASESQPAMVQIDFDAAASERAFYEAMLIELRARLGASARISMTALASWCESEAWIARLPAGTVDEAVPMLFRMGPDAPRVAILLEDGREFHAGICRASIGISDDELVSRAILAGHFPRDNAWKQKRIYVFHKGNWNAAATDAVLGELAKWHGDYSHSR